MQREPPQYTHTAPPPQVAFTRPSTVVILDNPNFHSSPKQITCPNCHSSVVTRLEYEVGGLTWLTFAVCCLVG